MIVFLASDGYSDLLQNSEEKFIHKYVKWRYDLNFFLKEEYANLMAMNPEWIVSEEKAIDDPSKIDGVIQCFPRTKFIYITSRKNEKEINGKCRTIYTDGFLKKRLESILFGKKVNLQQEQKKIGVITDQDPDLVKRFTLNLLYCIKRSEQLLVYTEVGQESSLEETAEKYGMLKTEKGYEYDGIPVLHNLVISQALINLFDFGVTDEKKEKMFEKCDYCFRISPEGKKIRVDLQGQIYTIAAFEHPFKPGQERFYAELLPELHVQVPGEKMRRYQHLMKEPKKRKGPKKPREKKNPVKRFQKKERPSKIKKPKPAKKTGTKIKLKLPKSSFPKLNFSEYVTKRRLMVFVGTLAFISIVAAGFRTFSAGQKKEKIKEAVKEQQSTVLSSTTEKTKETSSEKVTTTAKKKKEKPTTEGNSEPSQATTAAAVNRTDATRRLSQESRTATTTSKKRPKPTTTRKKKTTTTQKKKPTTTRRPKPTTTERFEIEHGPD